METRRYFLSQEAAARLLTHLSEENLLREERVVGAVMEVGYATPMELGRIRATARISRQDLRSLLLGLEYRFEEEWDTGRRVLVSVAPCGCEDEWSPEGTLLITRQCAECAEAD